MRNAKVLFLVLPLLLLSKTSFSQDFKVPENISLTSASDYEKYEDIVITGIKWLEDTPIDQQISKRKETSAFLLKWITGTPTFSIGLQAFQIELTNKNPDLLMSFLGGWTKYALENPDQKSNEVATNLAGFESLVKVYASNTDNGIKKDKKVEKFMKLNKQERENWIREQL